MPGDGVDGVGDGWRFLGCLLPLVACLVTRSFVRWISVSSGWGQVRAAMLR